MDKNLLLADETSQRLLVITVTGLVIACLSLTGQRFSLDNSYL